MDDPANPHATPAENARFAAFARRLEADGLSPATRACYASDWWTVSEQVHAATGRRFRLDRFGADDFLLHRAELAARGVSPATLNRRLAFLRRFAAFAAETDAAVAASARSLAEVPYQAVPRRPAPALSREQEQRLADAAESAGALDGAVVRLLLGTGLRASEAAALLRSDVAGPAALPRSVRIRGPRAKTVHLAPRAARALGAHLRGSEGGAADPVFRRRDGGPLGEEGISAIVARAARAAGVEATPRTLRHTFAVRYLSEHGDDVEGLARALGQQSLASARALRGAANAETPRPTRVRWTDLPEDEAAPLVRRRVSRGARAEVERLVFAPGSALPARSVPVEGIVYVLYGRVSVRWGGGAVEVSAGEVLHVPGGVRHEMAALGPRPAGVLVATLPARRPSPPVAAAPVRP